MPMVAVASLYLGRGVPWLAEEGSDAQVRLLKLGDVAVDSGLFKLRSWPDRAMRKLSKLEVSDVDVRQ